MNNNQTELSFKKGYFAVTLLMILGCLWNYYGLVEETPNIGFQVFSGLQALSKECRKRVR